jgi:hypothetical protein
MNRPGAGADAVMEATIAGVARAESDTDIGCGRVKTGAAPCRERLRGCDGAHLRGTGSVFGRTAHAMRCDESGALLS